MNSGEAIEQSIRETLARSRQVCEEMLEEARTGAEFKRWFRAEQERGRTLPPITLESDPTGDAPGGRNLLAG